MSDQLALDFGAIADEIPAWAAGCWYCVPDDFGQYDEASHARSHRPMVCDICGETEPNLLLFTMSHRVSLGASWGSGLLVCTSLWLRLNHLSYDLLNGRTPEARDLTALELGWTFAPDGERFAPTGWRTSEFAVECVPMERLA